MSEDNVEPSVEPWESAELAEMDAKLTEIERQIQRITSLEADVWRLCAKVEQILAHGYSPNRHKRTMVTRKTQNAPSPGRELDEVTP